MGTRTTHPPLDPLAMRSGGAVTGMGWGMTAQGAVGESRLVVLSGGPPELPRVQRLPEGTFADATRLILAHYGRHQRFVRTADTELVEGRTVPVFRFDYSTKIAE
jgi:hypothetical protein